MNTSVQSGTNQAFFYIDGIPTKGLWVDMDEITEWDQVKAQLEEKFPNSEVDEILCSDIEGLPKFFYASNCDSFGMREWAAFKEEQSEYRLEEDLISAYFDNCGPTPLESVEDAFWGEFDTDEDFARDYLEASGMLAGLPEHLAYYFDYEKYARDLMMDCFSSNGFYFRNL
jgi:antirestriction protein